MPHRLAAGVLVAVSWIAASWIAASWIAVPGAAAAAAADPGGAGAPVSSFGGGQFAGAGAGRPAGPARPYPWRTESRTRDEACRNAGPGWELLVERHRDTGRLRSRCVPPRTTVARQPPAPTQAVTGYALGLQLSARRVLPGRPFEARYTGPDSIAIAVVDQGRPVIAHAGLAQLQWRVEGRPVGAPVRWVDTWDPARWREPVRVSARVRGEQRVEAELLFQVQEFTYQPDGTPQVLNEYWVTETASASVGVVGVEALLRG